MGDNTTRVVSLASALSMYLLILGVASSPDLSRVSWGDAPTWITAVVALAALIAAWRAGNIAGKLLRVETDREDRAERLDGERRAAAERAEQADLVAAWNDRGNFVILNGSRLPIWEVELVARHPDRAETVEAHLALVPPNGQRRRPFVNDENVWGGPIPVEDILDEMDALRMQVEIRFRDATGRIWTRDPHGSLRLVGRSATVQAKVATASAVAAMPRIEGGSAADEQT
jgi:hypothetical protein